MAVWTDCQGGPSWFGGWAADMGEYTGPWPMMPPPNVDGGNPATGDEIDFVLGLPNAAHPGDTNLALDGTYDSPVWDCFRALNTGTPPPDSFTNYFRSSAGAGPIPGPSDVPPAGVHLYVVSYFGTGTFTEPPNPPESYVPTTYSARGACPNQTLPGGWSDWRSGLGLTGDASFSGGTDEGPTSGTPAPDMQSNTLADGNSFAQPFLDYREARSAAAAGVHPLLALGFGMGKLAPSFLHPNGFTSEDAAGGDPLQISCDYTASPSRPAAPPGLIYLVDYGDIPWAGAQIDYEDPDVSGFEWGTLHFTLGGGWTITPTGSAAGIPTPTIEIQVGVRTDPIPAGSGYVTDAVPIATREITPGTGTGSGGAGVDDSATMPTGLPQAVTLVMTPTIALTGVWDDAITPDFDGSGADGSYGWQVVSDWGVIDWSAQTGLWRYWRPDTVGPVVELRTPPNPEQFRTVGGAPFNLLIPGVGWVPWRDHGVSG